MKYVLNIKDAAMQKTIDIQNTAQNNDPMYFYYRVNNSKLDKPNVFERQIKKIIHKLVKTYDIKSEIVIFHFGTADDDILHDRFRLRISFNCANSMQQNK